MSADHRPQLQIMLGWIDIDDPNTEAIVVYGLVAVVVASLAILALTLRDTRGRFSLRLLFLITAYIAIGIGAACFFFRLVYRP